MAKALRRLGVALLVLLGVAATAAGVRVWRHDGAFRRARADVLAGRTDRALEALETLDDSRPVWAFAAAGEFDYFLGLARRAAGRRGGAAEALGRVPEHSPFVTRADLLTAHDEIVRGHWRAAESRLVNALERGGPGVYDVRESLAGLYRSQLRDGDAARTLRDGWADAPDPVRTLREIWRLEHETPDHRALGLGLEAAAGVNPDDPRVWLGRARLATATGRLDEAQGWLERCEASEPDEAVARAWLDWARAADRPDVVGRALRSIGPDRLDPIDWIGWRVWFARRSGDTRAERAALRTLVRLQPRNPAWLARAAELAGQAGETQFAGRLLGQKAGAEGAIATYSRMIASADEPATVDDRLAIGKAAEAAGRPADAKAWYTLAERGDPADPRAPEALRALEVNAPRLFADRPADIDPWSWSEPAPPKPPDPSAPIPIETL